MENGCFLPHFRCNIHDVCNDATLSCEGDMPSNIENLRNGIDRNNSTYGEEDYRVALSLGKAVTYTFTSPVTLSNIHLAFDSDLDRATLVGHSTERRRSMLANRTPDTAKVYVPKTLIKAYKLTATTEDGKTVTVAENERNLRNCVNHSMPNEKIVSISFIPEATWGESDTTVDVYSFDFR